MVRHVAVTAVCSLLCGSVAFGQQSLGALRLGYGAAGAGATARGYAYDPNNGYSYGYAVDGPNTDVEEMEANVSAGVNVSDGGASAVQTILVTSLITGPIDYEVYVPETTVAVSDSVNASTGFFCYYCYAGAGGFFYSIGYGQANDSYLIDDDEADCPCLTGYIDIIVTTQRQGNANTGGYVDVWVDKARVSNQTLGEYSVEWDGNDVLTIYTPPGGDINMIMQIIDCDYDNPVPLGSYAATNSGYGYDTYAYASGPDDLGNQALAGISVASWFEVEDYPCSSAPESPQGSIQYYEGEGEERDPDGDPVELEL